MSVDEAVARATQERPELVVAAAKAQPRAWGALAASGVLIFKELAGRKPTEAERRAIWAALWAEVRAVGRRDDT
jgi:hypothetical protein